MEAGVVFNGSDGSTMRKEKSGMVMPVGRVQELKEVWG